MGSTNYKFKLTKLKSTTYAILRILDSKFLFIYKIALINYMVYLPPENIISNQI